MPELNDNLVAILAKQGAGLPATLTGAGNLKVSVEEGGSGGGGGGAVTVADGADLALGATTDAAATTDAGTFSLIGLVKRLLGKLPAALGSAGGLKVDLNTQLDATNDSVNVGKLNGVTPTLDNTSRLGVSLYGKGWNNLTPGAAGDTELPVETSGAVKVIPIAIKDLGGNIIRTTTGADGYNAPANYLLPIAAMQYARSGTNSDQLRTPAKFKTATATAAGNTTIWTPASSKKPRVMRYRIEVTGDAAISGGGVLTLDLQDVTTPLGLTHSCYVPAAAANTPGTIFNTGWIDLGNGALSAAANNVIALNLSAALTSGAVRVILAGVEE